MDKSIVSFLCKYANVDAYSPWLTTYESITSGIGSGALIEYEGDIVILTCYHVVRGSSRTLVKYYPLDIEVEGEPIKISIELDLCLIKFDSKEIKKHCKPLKVAESVKRGETMRIVGFPENIENYSITKGLYGRLLISQYLCFRMITIQSDAVANGGNSGGPAINDKGDIIGVIHAKTTTEENIPTSLSIPWFSINYFLKIKNKCVECRKMNVRTRILPNTFFKEFYGIPKNLDGVLVFQGTTDNAIQQDDVISSIDDIPISERGRIEYHDNKLPWWIYSCFDAKKTVNLEIYRNGKKIKVVHKYPEDRDLVDMNPFNDRHKKYYFLSGFIFGVNNYNLMFQRYGEKSAMTLPDKYATDDPKEEDVLLLGLAPTPCTEGYIVNEPQHVLRLNDKVVKNLKQFYTAINTSDTKYVHIATDQMEIVIPREYIRKNKELAKTMINADEAYLGERVE